MTINSDNGIVRLVSRESVSEVLRRLLTILRDKGITLFAVVDHSGEAAKAGMEMHETKLVIFGKPEAGTPVMIAAPDSALDLPLKILIAELADGGTQVSYNKSSYLQARFDLSANLVANIAVIEQIAAAISGHN
jgi:uncharacterized protein (DUF302 family)